MKMFSSWDSILHSTPLCCCSRPLSPWNLRISRIAAHLHNNTRPLYVLGLFKLSSWCVSFIYTGVHRSTQLYYDSSEPSLVHFWSYSRSPPAKACSGASKSINVDILCASVKYPSELWFLRSEEFSLRKVAVFKQPKWLDERWKD